MNRFTKSVILAFSIFSAIGAQAAIFDSLESVDTLKTIAAKKTETDRMPASKSQTGKGEDQGLREDSAVLPSTNEDGKDSR